MCRQLVTKIREWCQLKEKHATQTNIDHHGNQIYGLMLRVLLGSLFSVIAAGLVFTDSRLIKSLGDPISQACLWLLFSFATILIILLLMSRRWNYIVWAADWFYRRIVLFALFPIVFVSIILRILSVYENGLANADFITWFFMIFLVLYLILLTLFMEHTRPLWAQWLKTVSFLLMILALASAINISTSLEQFKDTALIDILVNNNAAYRADCIIYLVGALIFIFIALILDYWNVHLRRDTNG
jgi:hypothetical protein